MKRFLSVLLLFILFLYPLRCIAEEEPYWTLQDVRGAFEQYVLPETFYSDPEQTMESLVQYGLFYLWDYYTSVMVPFETTYSYDEFAVDEMPWEGERAMLRLTMPYPEWEEHCYRIYLCYDPLTDVAAYYTVEYNKVFWDYCVIYERDSDGMYMDYSESTDIFYPTDPDYEEKLLEEMYYIQGLFESKIRWLENS